MSIVLYGMGPGRRPCWKIADFGISTAGTSKKLIATKERRGTACYSAPEILLAEGSIPSYSNKVDIWGFGTILYELWMGKRPFQTSYHVLQYFWNQLECPKLDPSSPHITLDPENTAENVIHLSLNLWTTMKIRFQSNPELIPSLPYPGTKTSVEIALNSLISLLLHRDGTKRPSIREVGHLIAANRLAILIQRWRSSISGLISTQSSSELMFLVEVEVAVPFSIHIHKAYMSRYGLPPVSTSC
jgi:serine/threonine protein kinase